MTWFVLTFILGLVAVGLWLASRPLRETAAPPATADLSHRDAALAAQAAREARLARGLGTGLLWASLVVAGLIVFFTLLNIVHQVPVGHVGVVYQFGDIIGQTGSGIQVLPPWQDLQPASIQVQRHRFENINAFSKETQDVIVVASLNYSVSPTAIQSLYRNVGPNWFAVLIEPRIQNFFKEETVKYESVQIAPNRENLRAAVRNRLAEDLRQYSINVADLLIDNLDFKPEFKAAIEEKQIATQNALREQERVAQRRNEAEQRIEEARGEAESTRIRAQGQAEANRLLGQSLTPEVIQFQALQKLGDKLQIAILPSGQGVIIDPAQLLGARPATPTPTPGTAGR
jgi:regulator of protease activity HflC (stomatin/prohibitin superfamily)